MQHIHPVTKETCEQIIHYITEVATNEEPQTYNKNMENLSNTLEDITKIILSESPRKKIDLLNLYMDKEKEAQQPQQNENDQHGQNNNPSSHQPLVQNLKSQNTTTGSFSKRRRSTSTNTKGTNRRRGQPPPLITLKPSKKNTSESKTRSPREQHLQ